MKICDAGSLCANSSCRSYFKIKLIFLHNTLQCLHVYQLSYCIIQLRGKNCDFLH